jgi:FlaA1/EpsC-like NDP-sugar epimerase
LILSKEAAAELVQATIHRAQTDDQPFIMTKAMKSVNMYKLAKLISDEVEIVGLRSGEKLNETLISENEINRTFIEKDHILIRQKENFGLNKVETILSSKTAEFMSDGEAIELIANTAAVLVRTDIDNMVY